MAWVKGSELSVGDVINKDTSSAYHHPYLVIATTVDRITMRNCTSHTSASFNTIEIPDGDKSGNQKWKNGESSYLVTNAETMVVPTINVCYQVVGFDSYEVSSGPPITQQFENPDGSMSFRQFQPMMVVTYPRTVPVHSNMEFYRIGKVSSSWMTENTG